MSAEEAAVGSDNPTTSHPVSKPVNKFNITSFHWTIWVAFALGASALLALLFSIKPDGKDSSFDDFLSDYVFEDRMRRAFGFGDDDDDNDGGGSKRRKDRSESRSSYIPPIIINNPGQNPTVIGGSSLNRNIGDDND